MYRRSKFGNGEIPTQIPSVDFVQFIFKKGKKVKCQGLKLCFKGY